MLRFVRCHWSYFVFSTATLAVTVGMNLVVFTIVNALWLRPLPFPNADRVVTTTDLVFHAPLENVSALGPFRGAVAGQVITDDLHGLRLHVAFDAIDRPLDTLAVTSSYFGVLDLRVRGRDFTTGDDRAEAEPVAILSNRLWLSGFGGRPDVVGAVIPAKPFPIRVIGVAPAGFEGARRGERTDIWVPSGLVPRIVPERVDNSIPLMVFGRLPQKWTLLDLNRTLRQRPGPAGRDVSDQQFVPVGDVFGNTDSRSVVLHEGSAVAVTAGLASVVLLGGCATLAALVLVHYERRRGEFALRIALGASQSRLMADSSKDLGRVAVTGAAGAVFVAVMGLRAIPALSLPGSVDLSRLDLSIDWRVLGAALASTACALAAAAIVPVSRIARGRLADDLFVGHGTSAPAASQRVRQILLALQVCAATVVLIAAGLFVRAVNHGFGDAPGFDVDHTAFVTMLVSSPVTEVGSDLMGTLAARTARAKEAIRSLPGVREVAIGVPPIDPDDTSRLRRPVMMAPNGKRLDLLLGALNGDPQLLSALGVPLLQGRALTVADGPSKPMPAIVTSSLAERVWPGQNALGQTASTWLGRIVVVGVASDFSFGSLARPAAGVVTISSGFNLGLQPRFVVRAADPAALVEGIRRAVAAAVPEAPYVKVQTGRELVARDLGRQRLGAWFFSGFGLTAFIIGVGGVFGLVAYAAQARRREFGIRLALGATTGDVLWRGVAAALVPVTLGLGVGLVLAGILSRVLTSLLTGLSALDPLTFTAVALGTVSCAGVAALGAAWRLRRMTPTEILRAN